jgi:hypothetical protein
VRISATTLESYRLWRHPEQEWMSEQDLQNTIRGVFVPNHKISLGQAFGRVLEDPDRYAVPGGFRIVANEEPFAFGRDVLEPCLALIDRRGVFEAKAQKAYGDVDVVSKADHLLGAHLREFKTTLSSFDVSKYLDSCQWRYMADAFEPSRITYHIFCLDEAKNGVVSLKDIHTFNLFPYADLHQDCCELLREFCVYVTACGLDAVLRQRQREAA